jgi:hypothetical protein
MSLARETIQRITPISGNSYSGYAIETLPLKNSAILNINDPLLSPNAGNSLKSPLNKSQTRKSLKHRFKATRKHKKFNTHVNSLELLRNKRKKTPKSRRR